MIQICMELLDVPDVETAIRIGALNKRGGLSGSAEG
jgi:hypothetical protein